MDIFKVHRQLIDGYKSFTIILVTRSAVTTLMNPREMVRPHLGGATPAECFGSCHECGISFRRHDRFKETR